MDEADIVKIDGRYAYIFGADNKLVITVASPVSEARVLSSIDLKDKYGLETGSYDGSAMLVASDSKTLMVIATTSYALEDVSTAGTPGGGGAKIQYGAWGMNLFTTSIMIVDITNKSSPEAISMEQIEGNYREGRLVGNHAYVIVNSWPQYQYSE